MRASKAVDAQTATEKEAFERVKKTHGQVHKEYMMLHTASVEAEKLRDESLEAAEKAWYASDKSSKSIGKVQAAAEAWSNDMLVFK